MQLNIITKEDESQGSVKFLYALQNISTLIPKRVVDLIDGTDYKILATLIANRIIILVTRRKEYHLTDIESFRKDWREGENINRVHRELQWLLKGDTIKPDDEILLYVDIMDVSDDRLEKMLLIRQYEGEKGLGIGKDFFTNALPKFAKKFGFKYIYGDNSQNNIDFFLRIVGRMRARDLPEEMRRHLSLTNTSSTTTVQIIE